MYASSFARTRLLHEGSGRRPAVPDQSLCNSLPADALLPAIESLLGRGTCVKQIEAVFKKPIADLYVAGLRLPLFQARRFWMLAEEESGDPCIGWQLGSTQPGRPQKGLAALFEAAPSLEQGFAYLQRYLPQFFGHLDLEIASEGRQVQVRLRDRGVFKASLQALDYLAAWLCCLVQRRLRAAGEPWPAGIELALGRTAFPGAERHVAPLGVQVHWAAPHYAVLLPEQLFTCPLGAGDSAQARVLVANFDAGNRVGHDGLLGAVCDYIASQLVHGPNIEDFCQRHRLLRRTVARQLRAQGWGFRALLEEHRRIQAIDLLQDLSLNQACIAELLGYQDLSSFSRAFSRWYGRTPGDCRPCGSAATRDS